MRIHLIFKSVATIASAAMISLSACSMSNDPLYRDGLWEPTHANRANLALQAANPSDLIRGTGTITSDGQLAAAAVDRLRTDKIKRLPAADISTVTAGNSGENNGSSGGP